MRRLLPSPAENVDLAAACAIAAPDGGVRPWTVGLMATTADGASAIGGASGPIGGDGDSAVFHAVRAAADAIVVGAGTAAIEGYGPARPAPEVTEARVDRDQAPRPTIFVVSGRLSVPADLRLFVEAGPDDPRPVVVHGPEVPASARRRLAAVADVVELQPGGRADRCVGGTARTTAGSEPERASNTPALESTRTGGQDPGPSADAPGTAGVDPIHVLEEVGRRGYRIAVVEGGPRLLGSVVAADLLDELFLTIDPRVVAGGASRIAIGDGDGHDRPWRPVHLLEQDGTLFWRLHRDRA